MKIHRSLQQALRLVCLLVFLTGCTAYGSTLGGRLAALPALQGAPDPADGVRVRPTNTQQADLRTQLPPGQAKKTKTPTPTCTFTPTPTPTLTPSATPTPGHPVTGFVLIQGGSCCIGGCVGQTVQIHVEFSASSPFGNVTGMRVGPGYCRTDQCMEAVPWEPLVPLKIYPFTLPPNWVTWSLTVQYRDARGNLSPVYYEEIDTEGWCMASHR